MVEHYVVHHDAGGVALFIEAVSKEVYVCARVSALVEKTIAESVAGVVDEPACFVVGGYDDKSFTVLCCPVKDCFHGLVKTTELVDHTEEIIAVAILVNMACLNHHKEAVVALLVEIVDCIGACFSKGRASGIVLAILIEFGEGRKDLC